MRLPADAIVIPRDKLTRYLLVARAEDDKSKYLAQAGYTVAHADELEAGIRDLVSQHDAEQDASNEYGVFYRVTGDLVGLNGRMLPVVTIWIALASAPTQYRFVTLKPARER
jgi:uncharacterized protein DUF6883